MPVHPLLKLGFFASHGGSGMRAVLDAIKAGELNAEAKILIANNRDCAAVHTAEANGLPWRHISVTTEGSPEAADMAIAQALQGAGAELVVLSGYMRKLGPETLRRFRHRVLNIHPALLPRHGGQGLYGRRVHEAVRASGDAITGASIHLVDSDYDTGPVIAQVSAPVRPEDTVQDIEARVRALEPGLLVETLRRIADGELELPG
ncbi:MAG TPA: phosphoribosylglycinamide formyltransferase [Caulobacteraceae bacterium]|nr:phosphoribosylglycinamide formyltransferase [Caulobacteraceae bacterium]